MLEIVFIIRGILNSWARRSTKTTKIGSPQIKSISQYTDCQSCPWPLTMWPKNNRVPPLIIHNLHVKFESDWAKSVVCMVSTRQSATDAPTHPLRSLGTWRHVFSEYLEIHEKYKTYSRMCRGHRIIFGSENKIEIGYQIKELWRRKYGLGDTFTCRNFS